jgi:hypothetical protein
MTPEHTDVDEYTCPEPGCEFVIGAAGPVADDEDDLFAEEVREHQAWHFADRVEAPEPSPWAKVREVMPPVMVLAGFLACLTVGTVAGVLAAPDPKPVIRTIVLDVPPACSEAIEAAQDERAHAVTEQQHTALADERATELADAALTLDPEAIEDAAKALDAEKRLVQQAGLDHADAAARFDEAAGDCLPEVDR